MNQFLEKFGDQIKSYWETGSEDQRQKLLVDLLRYANSNPQSFKRDLEEVQFDENLSALPIVFEALSKDTNSWGQFYVDTLDRILEQAKQSDKPQEILNHLREFDYIEDDTNPFIQEIVDRLYKEIDSDNLPIKLAVIWKLPVFLSNPTVRNKSLITDSLQKKLHDNNWKVRYVAFKSLGYEDMLPSGYKPSLGDQIRKLVFGEPPTV